MPLFVVLQFCDSFPLIVVVIDRVHVRVEYLSLNLMTRNLTINFEEADGKGTTKSW